MSRSTLPRPMRDGWRNVWLLALVSLIADVSGEMVMAVLPFVLVAQGATGLGLGLVGGITEGVGHVMQLVGGYIDQRFRRSRLLIGAGYLVAALSRFGIAAATAWPATLAFRSLDRVGKGLRTAPRDALLADGVAPHERARAFGLHRAADTAGAVLGVLLAVAALHFYGASHESIVFAGAVIGLATVGPLFFVADRSPSREGTLEDLEGEAASPHYVPFLLVAALFATGRISYLFFLVRAAAGTSVLAAILWYLLFNVAYFAASYPAGTWADRWGRRRMLLVGYLLGAASAVPFALDPRPVSITVGFVLLGLSYAAVEGNARALAADLAGRRSRASRLGEYHAFIGFAALAGGILAGLLWDGPGPAWAFGWAAAASLAAACGLAGMIRLRMGERRFA